MKFERSIVVLHRTNWKDRAAAPCTMEDEYSIDGGDTWMSRAQFHNWHNNLIEIVDITRHCHKSYNEKVKI